MKVLHKKRTPVVLAIILVILSIFSFLLPAVTTASAAETSDSIYTDVMDDLLKDENFDVADYPVVIDDFSLNVIQIAESSDGELFVYVYQPSDPVKDLYATTIRLSMPIAGSVSSYADYNLVLLNSVGVFDKYKVENLTVKSDGVRYYEIVQITRPFDVSIDKALDNDNVINEVPFAVNQQWTVYNIDGQNVYEYLYLDTIRIETKFCGSIRYSDGYFGSVLLSDTDAWFVAFKTDKDIERLVNAKLSYRAVTYHESVTYITNETTISEIDCSNPALELSADFKGSSAGNGLFGYKYSWNRIVSIDNFIADVGDNLTAECRAGLSDPVYEGGWVLRFLETDFSSGVHESIDPVSGAVLTTGRYKTWSEVSSVTILELTYETKGKVYHLGVVDNFQSPDNIPDGEYDLADGIEQHFKDFLNGLRQLFKNLIKGLLLIFLLFLVGYVLWHFGVPLLSFIWNLFVLFLKLLWKGLCILLKFFWTIISFPFKLIGKLFAKKETVYEDGSDKA